MKNKDLGRDQGDGIGLLKKTFPQIVKSIVVARRHATTWIFFLIAVLMVEHYAHGTIIEDDGYYVAYKPITLPCILFMFIEMKFIHCHSCVMFAMKSMSMCND